MADDSLSDDAGDPGIIPDREVVHPNCDVFTVSPEKVAAMVAKGHDPRVVRIRAYRRDSPHGVKNRIPGHMSPDKVSTDKILHKYGPGTYEFHGLNELSQFVISSTMHLSHGFEEDEEEEGEEYEEAPQLPIPAQMPTPPGIDPMFAFMMQQQQQQSQMMMQMVMQTLNQNNGGGMQQLAESIAASTAANNQALQGITTTMAGNFAAQASSPLAQNAAQQSSLMEKIVLQAMQREPSQQAGSSPAELMMALAAMKDDDNKSSEMFWTEIFPTLIDGLGAPVLGAMAATMKGPKGEMLNALLQQHLKTREAEANADAAAAPDVVDTVGV